MSNINLVLLVPENGFLAIALLFLVVTAIVSIIRWILDVLP